jgi:hypothetical protein
MSLRNANGPYLEEIEAQLIHLLNSQAFRAHRALGKLLSYIVTKHLAGEEITAKQIGFDLISPHYDPSASNVRTLATMLRGLLQAYYTGDGALDLVIITLPAGKSYCPVYSYNPLSPALSSYREGMSHLNRFVFLLAIFRFGAARAEGFAPGAIAEAHAMIFESICRGQFALHGRLSHARKSVESIRASSKDLWEAHVMAGAFECLRYDWSKAEAAFDAALKTNSPASRQSWWYLVYLLARGESLEALRIAKAKALRNPEVPLVVTAFGFILYLNRDFSFASKAAHVAGGDASHDPWSGDDPPYPLGLLLNTCLHLALNEPAEALECMQQVPKRRFLRFKGLMVLCLARAGNRSKALLMLAKLNKRVKRGIYEDAFQMAIAHMALGRDEEALGYLEAAYKKRSPMMLLLHLLPILDPLRGHKRFQSLIHRMDLRLPQLS